MTPKPQPQPGEDAGRRDETMTSGMQGAVTTGDQRVEIVARLIAPDWFHVELDGPEDRYPLNNYDGQHLKYRSRSREMATKVVAGLDEFAARQTQVPGSPVVTAPSNEGVVVPHSAADREGKLADRAKEAKRMLRMQPGYVGTMETCTAVIDDLLAALRQPQQPTGDVEEQITALINKIEIAPTDDGYTWAAKPESIQDCARTIAMLIDSRTNHLAQEVGRWKAGWSEMWEKLGNGTLHQGKCNADHSGPVGGPACSCRLGHVIKELRRRVEAAEQALSTAREALTFARDFKITDGDGGEVAEDSLHEVRKVARAALTAGEKGG